MILDVTDALLRLSRASTAFGIDQASNLLRPARHEHAARRFDAVTSQSRQGLDEMSRLLLQTGDDLQEDALEWMSDAFIPTRWGRAFSTLTDRSRDLARVMAPGDVGDAARREIRNKIEIYRLVKSVSERLDVRGFPEGPKTLAEHIDRAYELDEHEALWMIEGLAHDYTVHALRRGGEMKRCVDGLLLDPALEAHPSALPMLHAGFGLALAEHVCLDLASGRLGDATRFTEQVEQFRDACLAGARPEHAATALEALGLEARCFFASLVPGLATAVDALAQRKDDTDRLMTRYFWHGLGRALYFLPVSLMPGMTSIEHALDMARREAPEGQARADAIAGLAYAFALVNLAHPQILENLLRRRGEALEDSFFEAVAASVRMRQEITPESVELRAFLDHAPADEVLGIWNTRILEPALEARDGRLDNELYKSLQSADSQEDAA